MKEGQAHPGQSLAHEFGRQHQVIVMDPDEIVPRHRRYRSIRETLVDFPIDFEVQAIEPRPCGQRVHQGP